MQTTQRYVFLASEPVIGSRSGPDIEPLPLLITGIKLRTAVSTERLYTSVTLSATFTYSLRAPVAAKSTASLIATADMVRPNLLTVGAMARHHHIRINLRSDLDRPTMTASFHCYFFSHGCTFYLQRSKHCISADQNKAHFPRR